MNDRFKFRVWNNKYNEYEDDLYYEAGDLQVTCVNKVFEEYISDGYNIIEQCTGLKDKNGKLIYEGDIVKINGWWDAFGPAGYDKNQTIVKWNKKFAGFEPMCMYDCDCGVYHDAEECEIIGNIHENADLLGE